VRRCNLLSLPVFLFLLAASGVLPALETQLVATPRARALPLSKTNRPFLAAARTAQPVALDTAGYAESEFIVSGQADIYEWTGTTPAQLTVRTADVPYATRMLLRRPTDRRKFSGVVVVELLDASELYDRAPLWGLSWQQFLRRGDAWVGITVHPGALAALRKFDPVRYAALGFTHRQQCGQDQQNSHASALDTESGLAWGVIAQVGALLRSSSKENPLLELNPRFLIAAGHAQAGAYVTTYANALHALLRRGDDAPVYDGFLSAAATRFAIPINRCTSPPLDGDPRRGVMPRDVPFVAVTTEADFNLLPALRRADSDAPADLFRLYEIPGAYAEGFPAGVPAVPDLQIAALALPATGLCAETPSDLPQGLAYNAIWQQYADWLTTGRPMLSLPRIETLADGGPRRDEMGNATGGWRLPQLEVPLARYAGRSTPRDASNPRAAVNCSFTGAKWPFEPARLKSQYRDRAGYLRLFRAAVDRAVQEGRLVREDGEVLKGPQGLVIPAF
jgi:hypothetical protein